MNLGGPSIIISHGPDPQNLLKKIKSLQFNLALPAGFLGSPSYWVFQVNFDIAVRYRFNSLIVATPPVNAFFGEAFVTLFGI